jgi:hypothetical protein
MAHTVPTKIFSGGSVDLLRTHTSSPTRSLSPGTAIDVFDACLVNGFGQVTLSSLTIDAQGIATATSTAHGYLKVHTVILIAGADQEAINGEWIITDIPNADTVKFDASDSGLTSTTITGTMITMKVAPLGWARPFSDASNYIAVYQSLNPMSRRNFLRVDDSDNLAYNDMGATYFRGYEYMTSSQDNGTYPFPPKSALVRGVNSRKLYHTQAGVYLTLNATNISWVLVGNANQFFFSSHTIFGNDKRTRMLMFFGDLNSYVPGDVGATLLSADIDLTGNTAVSYGVIRSYGYNGNYCPRNSKRTHTVSQQRFRLLNYPTTVVTDVVIGSTSTIAEPDIYPNRVILYRPFLVSDENTANSIRGEMPGMSIALNDFTSLSPGYEPGEVITLNGERFAYIPTYAWNNTIGFILLTLDRDWNVPILQ